MAAKKCRADGCKKMTTGIEGYCSDHRHLSLTRRYAQLKQKARRKNGELDISLSDYEEILKSNSCEYCSGPLPKTGHGLDRVDTNKPYNKDNVVPCCHKCNYLKGNRFSYEQTKKIVDFIKKMEYNNWSIPTNGRLGPNNKGKR